MKRSGRSPKWNFILVLKGLNQLLFHNALFRNSQGEDIPPFQPTNHINVSDSNNEDLNKVDEGVC